MRIAALTVPALLLVTGGCTMFDSQQESPFDRPNTLMADEIKGRVAQIPFQHRDELLQNLLWLAQTGETAITALLDGLQNDSPKMRSSCAWVLGRIHDRRTIPYLQPLTKDSNETVRMESARSLVLLGDLQQVPLLIAGLDDTRKEVRYLCHEALKAAAGRDFGFDHLGDDEYQRRLAVLGWRQWWSDYSGDPQFAETYRQQYNLNVAAPMGEVKPQVVETSKENEEVVRDHEETNENAPVVEVLTDLQAGQAAAGPEVSVEVEEVVVEVVTQPEAAGGTEGDQVKSAGSQPVPVSPVPPVIAPTTPVQVDPASQPTPVRTVVDPQGRPVPLPPSILPTRPVGSGGSGESTRG